MGKIIINNEIDIAEMWEGLGGNFDSIQQIIFEFVDNSISNILNNQKRLATKQINIVFNVENDNRINITIEDSGTGILNLDNAFKIGNKSSQETPLNEHGFGMKHALAAADKNNSNWWIATRDYNNKLNKNFLLIKAPYKTFIEGDEQPEEEWPGSFNMTGTIIGLTIDKNLLSTLTVGIPGANYNTSYRRMIEYFIEDLSFTYSGIIEDNSIHVNVKLFRNEECELDQNITPLKPSWIKKDIEGEETYDLGSGLVKIKYIFGSIEASDNIRYYRRNMQSSGAEIRINGRVMINNLVSEIWPREQHNSINHFLAIIDICSNDKNKLPTTKTAKNSFNFSDKKYEKLVEWILKIYPKIEEIEDSTSDYNEVKMFKDLKQKFEISDFHKNDRFSLEEYVFEQINMKLRIDLYAYVEGNIIIFEGKKKKTTPKDVYQLRMYWDGLVFNNVNPSQGILLGENHPESVLQMIEYINKMKDANGNNYKFIIKTWDEYNITQEQ